MARAVDNSNIVPAQYVHPVVALAKENGITAQYGVTGGGNDGSVFLRYGSVDVALGWPLRYSHSPAEVIDTKDLGRVGKKRGGASAELVNPATNARRGCHVPQPRDSALMLQIRKFL